MLKRTPFGVALLFVLALPVLFAQNDTTDTDDDDAGEGAAIEQRVKWFYGSRGLDQISRPDLLRRNAVQQVESMREEEYSLAQTNPWTQIGPSPMTMLNWGMGNVSGRVSSITVHPTNNNIIYLGTAAGGLWKTTNGGTSWVSLTSDLATQSVGSCFVDPANPQTVWLGTGENNSSCAGYFGAGIFRSTDGGATFSPRNGQAGHQLDLSFVSAITAHPSNGQMVLAAGHGFCVNGALANGGIYRTTDGGLNWDLVLSGQAADLISDPNNANVFYASVGKYSDAANGIYKSTNAGASWVRLTSGIESGTTITRVRLAMAPSNSNTLYAYTSGGKVFKTTNAGSSWSTTGTGACEGQCTYNLCFAVSPTSESTLLIGSIRFGRSTNSGASLTYLTSSWGSGQKVHQDTHVLVYDRTDANKFWVGCDGGIWRTDNGGSSFVNLNANLNITQFYDIAVSPTDISRVYGGAQDNSSLGSDNNVVWDVNLVTGDGFMNLVDPLNANNVFQTSYPGNLPALYRSTSGGGPNSFSSLSMAGVSSGSFPWVTPLAISANSAKTKTYLFVGSNKVFMSSNNGTNWSSLSSSILAPSGSLSIIEALPDGTKMMVYAGSASGGIYRTNDATVASPSWSTVTGNYPGGTVTDIAADPANPLRVFVTRGAFGSSKLYRSTTGGTNWSAVGTGLPDVPANSVAIDPFDSNRIFVGTDVGVFESENGGDSFSTLMLGFPMGTVVTDLEISKTPHVLSAGTYGRGAWQVDLAQGGGNTPPAANFSFNTNGLTASFTDLSSDPDGSVASRSWNFGDGGASTQTNPNHAYSVAGTYTVVLTVTDNLGATSSANKAVTVSSQTGALTDGVPVTGISGATGSWSHYYIDVPSGASNLTITTSGGSGDGDLYIKFGAQPTSSVYDCKSTGSTNAESCSQANPSAGRWYASIYHYATTSGITLLADYTLGTPPVAAFTFSTSGLTASFTDGSSDPGGSISARSWNFGDGSTSTATNPSHTYASAATYTVSLTVTDNDGLTNATSKAVEVKLETGALTDQVPVTGIGGATGTWSYFYIDVPAGATNLSVTTSGGSGDGDLYTKFGAQPTTSVFDCSSTTSTNAETCSQANPSAGRWHVGIYHYATTSGITLVADYSVSNCTPYSNTQTALAGNTGTWKHSSVTVPACATQLVAASSGGTGDADLYVREGAQPTLTVYNCRPYKGGNAETCTLNAPTAGIWYVSLYGYATYSGVSLTISYQ